MDMNDRELLAAHGELMEEVRRTRPGYGPYSDDDVPGQVAPWVLPRLVRCAERLGYPVEFRPDDRFGGMSLGYTRTEQKLSRDGTHALYRPGEIRITPGLSPVSTVRTLAHELAHAVNHVEAAREHRPSIAGGLLEEVTAETAGALVSQTLRVPAGVMSACWLATAARPNAVLLMQRGRNEAIRRASLLLKAIA